jgi:hypothetical protein
LAAFPSAERDLTGAGALDRAGAVQACAVGAGPREHRTVQFLGERRFVAHSVLQRQTSIERTGRERIGGGRRVAGLDGHHGEVGAVGRGRSGVGSRSLLERAPELQPVLRDGADVWLSPDEGHVVATRQQPADQAAETARTEDDDVHARTLVPGRQKTGCASLLAHKRARRVD